MTDPMTYATAGVDIEAGNRLVDRIKPLAALTARPGADTQIGGFGGIFDLNAAGFTDPLLVSATDGVGTKLDLAVAMSRHDTIGIDLVAMCVNDLVVQGATPLFFLDYFATGSLDVAVAADVVKGIAHACRDVGCALLGGETAEMPGLYEPGRYDLAGFAVGAVERSALLPRRDIQPGDQILGMASSGIHSNGVSLVRRLVADQKLAWSDPAPFASDQSLGDIFLTPTRLYVRSVLAAHKLGYIKALAHITGGGLVENIPRVMPEGLCAHIDMTAWDLPPLFTWLGEVGALSPLELYRTFNCGIGMVAIIPPDQTETAIAQLHHQGEHVCLIGQVTEDLHHKVRLSGPDIELTAP